MRGRPGGRGTWTGLGHRGPWCEREKLWAGSQEKPVLTWLRGTCLCPAYFQQVALDQGFLTRNRGANATLALKGFKQGRPGILATHPSPPGVHVLGAGAELARESVPVCVASSEPQTGRDPPEGTVISLARPRFPSYRAGESQDSRSPGCGQPIGKARQVGPGGGSPLCAASRGAMVLWCHTVTSSVQGSTMRTIARMSRLFGISKAGWAHSSSLPARRQRTAASTGEKRTGMGRVGRARGSGKLNAGRQA